MQPASAAMSAFGDRTGRCRVLFELLPAVILSADVEKNEQDYHPNEPKKSMKDAGSVDQVDRN